MSETFILYLIGIIILGFIIIIGAVIYLTYLYLKHFKDMQMLIKSNTVQEYSNSKVMEKQLQSNITVEEDEEEDDEPLEDLQDMDYSSFEKAIKR
jgi:predicted Holliday junction resolvase-like endonuclease